MMADTNATSNGTTSGQEAVPQWKKELLQRRKNLAKTIGAASVPVHDSASTVAAALTTPTTPRAGGPAGNPFGGAPNVSTGSSSGSGQKGTRPKLIIADELDFFCVPSGFFFLLFYLDFSVNLFSPDDDNTFRRGGFWGRFWPVVCLSIAQLGKMGAN